MLCVLLAVISCLLSINFEADATGSRNLTATLTGTTWADNTGYRPYIEWNDASTAGIVRHQIIKVYVNAGETLYFGSSVANGYQGIDIVVRKPDGTAPAASLDVNAATGAGYINTRAKEMAGPNYAGSSNIGGYTPLSIVVDQTGVWEFEFHSTNPTTTDINPTGALTTASPFAAGGVGVAAWDVTVVKQNAEVVTGRVFTNFLSLNMGLNRTGTDVLKASVYVLTKDGYVYETNFNGMDPYGFIFYANNRGLVKAESNTSLYQSGVSSDNIMTTILSNGISAQFQSPNNSDTTLDSTYKIFFEIPASDLPEDIKPTPYAPGTINDFIFTGDTSGHGYVGSGGYFDFTANKVSSFQIVLDFTNYKSTDGTVNNRGVVYLANACIEGPNRIFWDGKDGNGNVVPAGSYGGPDSGVSISIVAKAGEYHFPLYDVENNKNGIAIRMISDPLGSDNLPMTVTSAERTTVYYNNSPVPLIAAEDVLSGRSSNQLAGMDSMTGASKFGTAAPFGQGDFSALDIWTYYTGGSAHPPVVGSPFTLADPPVGKSNIKGFAFYDTDSNMIYKMFAGDYSLQGVPVELYKDGVLTATTVTDSYGLYYFSNIDYGNYTINILKPYDYSICTTNNLSQPLTVAASGWLTAADVGFVYAKADKTITVCKLWTVSRAQDSSQPDNITVHVTGINGTYDKIAVLSNTNGWQATFSDLPKYAADGVTVLDYEVSEEAIPKYFQVSKTSVSTSSQITYTFTNAPLGRITLTKVDSNDLSNELAGATFEFWEKGGASAISTETTDADGVIHISGLDAGTYYFKETIAPAGYAIDLASAVTADIVIDHTAAGYNQSLTVTNTPYCDFTLTKTITAPSDKDEQFLFEITGPTGTYYSVITVLAGQTAASQSFAGMPVGTYSVVEKSSNWRYSIQTESTNASDGTSTFPYAGGQLSMLIDNPLSTGYQFAFVDSRTVNAWVSDHSRVTNTMVKPALVPVVIPTAVPTATAPPTPTPTPTPTPAVTYVRVNSVTDNGTYVIVAKNGTSYYALSNATYNTDYLSGVPVTVTIDNANIEKVTATGITAAMEWTFIADGSGYDVMNGTNYLDRRTNGNGRGLSVDVVEGLAAVSDWIYDNANHYLYTRVSNGNGNWTNYYLNQPAAFSPYYFRQRTQTSGTIYLYKKE